MIIFRDRSGAFCAFLILSLRPEAMRRFFSRQIVEVSSEHRSPDLCRFARRRSLQATGRSMYERGLLPEDPFTT